MPRRGSAEPRPRGRGRPQTTSTRLYAGGELQGSPVWQALAGAQPHAFTGAGSKQNSLKDTFPFTLFHLFVQGWTQVRCLFNAVLLELISDVKFPSSWLGSSWPWGPPTLECLRSCTDCGELRSVRGLGGSRVLWCWRRLLRVPWTARSSNQSILKAPENSHVPS